MQGDSNFGLVITPNRSAAKELLSLYRLSQIPVPVQNVANSLTLSSMQGKGIRITTSHCLNRAIQGMSFSNVNAWFQNLKMVICENLELLDAPYELVIATLLCRTQTLPVRFVGLATCLDDPRSLCHWLRVPPQGTFCFRPKDREQPLTVKPCVFTIPYSAALYKAMARPAYIIVHDMSPTANAVLFTPTLSLCHSIAADLIAQCAPDNNTRGFLGMNVNGEDLQHHVSQLGGSPLAGLLTHGIGIFHPSMVSSDITLTLRLYLEGVIRVMIAPRDCCWTLPVKGNVVIVMGTQYVKSSSESSRQIVNYSIQEVARMQTYAISQYHLGQFHLFCPAEHRDPYLRFLNEGLPLESELIGDDTLKKWLQDQRKVKSSVQKQDVVDALSFTFLFRRLDTNPAYYEAHSISKSDYISRLIDRVWDI